MADRLVGAADPRSPLARGTLRTCIHHRPHRAASTPVSLRLPTATSGLILARPSPDGRPPRVPCAMLLAGAVASNVASCPSRHVDHCRQQGRISPFGTASIVMSGVCTDEQCVLMHVHIMWAAMVAASCQYA